MPFQIWTTGSLVLFLIYSTIVPEDTTSHFWWLARTVRYHLFPPALFTAAWLIVLAFHTAEGVYAATLARKHRMPWHIAVRVLPRHFFFFELSLRLGLTWDSSQTAWVGFTTVFGAPVLLRLRHHIKQARIESIMKGH